MFENDEPICVTKMLQSNRSSTSKFHTLIFGNVCSQERFYIVITFFLAVMREIPGYTHAIFRWKHGKATSSIIVYSSPVVSVADVGITVVGGAGVVEVTVVVSWIAVVDPGAVVIAGVDLVVVSGVVVGSPIVVG